MATLQSASGDEIELAAEHLIGRSSRAHTQLSDPAVSGQHATIRWTGTDWQVRDLGSRNGTWIDGVRLPNDEAASLSTGHVVWFGGAAHAYSVIDTSPPSPFATSGDLVVQGDTNLLALPSEDDPQAVLTFEVNEGWTLSVGEDTRTVANGEQIEVEGQPFVLNLPEPVLQTVDATRSTLAEPKLSFRVSADEEYVEVAVEIGTERHHLPPRSHHYPLLVLARTRLDDAAGDVPESEQGWLYTSSLAEQLKVTMNRLYVTLHRCRKELEALHEGAGTSIIDKRVTTRQIRVGWSAIEIGRL